MVTGIIAKVRMPIVQRNNEGKEELIKYVPGENVPLKYLLETDNTVDNENLNFILKDKTSLSNKLKLLVMSTVNKLADNKDAE